MATFTPYLNLEKPTTSERLDVLKINSNWDKIDAGVSALNTQISSQTGGVPKRIAGICENGSSFTVTINADYSMHEGFALVAMNLGGNALGGVALLFLGRGTQKVKDIIGSMSSSYWSASYSNNVWTITNNSGSQMYYTILLTK